MARHRAKRNADPRDRCRFCAEKASRDVWTLRGHWRVCDACYGKRWKVFSLLEQEYAED